MAAKATGITMESINDKLDKLLLKMDSIDAIQTDITKLKVTVETLESAVKDATKMQEELSDLKKSVEYANDTACEAKQMSQATNVKTDTMKHTVEQLTRDNARLHSEHKALHTRLVGQEAYTRRDNLILHGIEESPGENVLNKVHTFLEKELKLPNANTIKFVRTHRLGTYSKGTKTCRPIIMRFHFFGDRELVWRNKSQLKGKSLWISEDFPQEIMDKRKQLLPVLKAAWQNGNKASLRVDKLIIDDKSYTVETLDKIPKDIDPSLTCEKISPEMHLFFGRYSPFSNFYSAAFTCDSIDFGCVEQYGQYQKALIMNDQVSAQKILEEDDPGKQKAIGRRNANFDRHLWESHATGGIKEGCLKKFTAHSTLKNILKQSGKRILAEASPSDVYWGIGLSLRDPLVTNQDKWGGRNELGKILMAIRRELRE
jgi:ribA/ribD-fused uncharacterized protein